MSTTFFVGIKRITPICCDVCVAPIHDGAIMVGYGESRYHGGCVTLVRSGGVIVGARRAENGDRTAADEFRDAEEIARSAKERATVAV